MSKKKKTNCGDCRYQISGFDGGFFGLLVTCECRIFGETENRKNCRKFEKKITRNYLFEKIRQLEKENEQLQKQVKSSETTSNATSNYNDFLESKIKTLEKENDNCKNDYRELFSNYVALEEENEELKIVNLRLQQQLMTYKGLRISEIDDDGG